MPKCRNELIKDYVDIQDYNTASQRPQPIHHIDSHRQWASQNSCMCQLVINSIEKYQYSKILINCILLQEEYMKWSHKRILKLE